MHNKEKYLYQIEDLFFSYSLGAQTVTAIQGVNVNIPESALVAISGPSGSGKSTFLNILGLIEPIQKGQVLFLGQNIGDMSEKQKNHIRKFEFGFIFQQFNLFPILNAEDNVKYFLTRQGLPKNEIRDRSEEALTAVGLWEHRHKKPSEMSGGQKQRVAIARALAKRPKVIIGDEPTASLDQKTGQGIMEILSTIVTTRKTSIILTTHDAMVQSFATHTLHMQDGRF